MSYTVDLNSQIGKRWLALGGSSGLGDPIGPLEKLTSYEHYQRFPGGVLYWVLSRPLAFLVDIDHFDKWLMARQTIGARRIAGDSFSLAFPGSACPLDDGTVIKAGSEPPYVVDGGIYARYRKLVDLHAAVKAPFGMPLADRDTSFGFQPFEGGILCVAAGDVTSWLLDPEVLAAWATVFKERPDAIGRPTEDTFTMAFGGRASVFERGVVVRRPGHDPVVVDWPIYERYAAMANLHGAAKPGIGLPVGDRDTTYEFQEFENGVIFWSPGLGSVLVDRRVMAKWRLLAVPTTGSGESIRDYLGRPADDSFRSSDGGVASHFERGMIVVRSDGRAFEVHGAIYERYRFLGLERGPSFLGLPESDVKQAWAGGRCSEFVHGDIYWHPQTGAWEVHGAIRDRWEMLGGARGPLGYPRGGEEDILSGDRKVGQMSRFVGDPPEVFPSGEVRIYSSRRGAWEVAGGVLRAWLATGGPTGPLGFPISGQQRTPTRVGIATTFEHGVGVWLEGREPVAVTGLAVRLVELRCDDSFKVQYRVRAMPSGESVVDTIPSIGELAAGTTALSNLNLLEVPRVDIDTRIEVWLNGIHERWLLKDKRLGTIAETYSVENLWGIDDTRKHDANDFSATYVIAPHPDLFKLDPAKFVTEAFWPFEKFTTGLLTWQQFADTFSDVSPEDAPPGVQWMPHLPQPFKWIFYTQLYMTLAQPGNCVGTCVEAMYALLNRSPFVEPLYTSRFNRYRKDGAGLDPDGRADDREAAAVINIKHGYQLGAPMVARVLTAWAYGELRDPVRAFRESREQWLRGEYPMLCLSASGGLRRGHAVLPYQWFGDPDKDTHVWIKVADPNDSGGAGDPNYPGSSTVHVFPQTNQFLFEHSPDGAHWEGTRDSGGRMWSVPMSVLSSQPALPLQHWWLQLISGAIILLAGDANSNQLMDDEGHTFYEWAPPGHARIPNEDPHSRMRGVALIPLAARARDDRGREGDMPAEEAPSLYFLKRTRSRRGDYGFHDGGTDTPAIRHEVIMSAGGTYQWGCASGTFAISVVVDAVPGAIDLIRIADFARETQVVTFQFARSAKAPRMFAAAVQGPAGPRMKSLRWFRLSDIEVEPGHSLGFHVADGGRTLALINPGRPLTFDLGMHVGVDPAAAALRSSFTLESDHVTRVRPTDWAATAIAATPIRVATSRTLSSPILKRSVI